MIVNFFHPEFWIKHGHWGYYNQTPNKSGIWKDFEFRFNPQKKFTSDFLVVHEDIDQIVTQKVMYGGAILIIGEERAIKNYDQDFIDQFDIIVTSRDDIRHSCILKSHYLHPWWIKKTYDELFSIDVIKKTNELSAVISSLTILPSHKQRYAFVNKLKGHYKENIDWFSKGEVTQVEDKWDGLAPYKYSIAIENSNYPNYFTEKISDCFLSFTMPLYSGCSNIKDFFDDRSFVIIYPDDYLKSIEIIDEVIESNLYSKNFQFIAESRQLVLEKYHLVAALSELLSKVEKSDKRIKRTIYPQNFYRKGVLEKIVKSSFKHFS